MVESLRGRGLSAQEIADAERARLYEYCKNTGQLGVFYAQYPDLAPVRERDDSGRER